MNFKDCLKFFIDNKETIVKIKLSNTGIFYTSTDNKTTAINCSGWTSDNFRALIVELNSIYNNGLNTAEASAVNKKLNDLNL